MSGQPLSASSAGVCKGCKNRRGEGRTGDGTMSTLTDSVGTNERGLIGFSVERPPPAGVFTRGRGTGNGIRQSWEVGVGATEYTREDFAFLDLVVPLRLTCMRGKGQVLRHLWSIKWCERGRTSFGWWEGECVWGGEVELSRLDRGVEADGDGGGMGQRLEDLQQDTPGDRTGAQLETQAGSACTTSTNKHCTEQECNRCSIASMHHLACSVVTAAWPRVVVM